MRRFGKVFAAVAVLALASGALAGCGGSQPAPAPAPAPAAQPAAPAPAPKPAPVTLSIWSYLVPETELPEMKKMAEEWAAKTGNKVDFVKGAEGFQAFATAAQSDKAPDMVFGIAHDNLGPFYKAGLLAPVPDGIVNKADFVPLALDADSFDGKLMGVPLAMEAVALFYNTDKVKEAPKDWKSFIESAKANGFMYDVKTFYFSYGFIGGQGGYVFKNNGGALDPRDVGLGNAGAVAGLNTLKSFVDEFRFMPKDVNGDVAKAAFQTGKSAYYISGPWDVGGLQKAGVKFGVAPVPALENGKPFQPFVGVYSAFVSSTSKNQKVAWELMKYMVDNSPMPLFRVGNRIPVQKKYLDNAEVKANALLAGFGASAANGVPMPNIAAMGQVWDPMGKAIDAVLSSKQDAQTAATNAVKAIGDGIKSMG